MDAHVDAPLERRANYRSAKEIDPKEAHTNMDKYEAFSWNALGMLVTDKQFDPHRQCLGRHEASLTLRDYIC